MRGRNNKNKNKTTLEKGYWHSGLADEFGMHMVKVKMTLRPVTAFVFCGCEFFTATLCKIILVAWFPSSSCWFHITKSIDTVLLLSYTYCSLKATIFKQLTTMDKITFLPCFSTLILVTRTLQFHVIYHNLLGYIIAIYIYSTVQCFHKFKGNKSFIDEMTSSCRNSHLCPLWLFSISF